MRLAVWDPFKDMAALRRVLNAPFREFSTRSRITYPPMRIMEEGDSVVIAAELPGVSKDEVELTILGDTLTVAGEKKLPTAEGVSYIRHERPHHT